MNFGILCSGTILQHWQAETVRLLTANGHTCRLLIVDAETLPETRFLDKIRTYPWSHALVRFWFRFMVKPAAKRPADVTPFLGKPAVLRALAERRGYGAWFNPQDLETIRTHELDFILRFGFGILKGEILESARYGIWSFHHDDDRKYRGVPTGFWEILFRDPVNAAILQRLTPKIDSGVILHKGYFNTVYHSWEGNIEHLFSGTVEWPLQVCRRIENGDTDFLSVTNVPGSPIYRLPGNLLMTRFLVKLGINKLKFHFRDLFRTEKWRIGILPGGTDSFLNEGAQAVPQPVWIQAGGGPSVYHADPFAVRSGDYLHVLCEEYDYKTAKGIIVSLMLDARTYKTLRKTTALELSHHLAFPFVFENEGIIYCLPENSAGGNVDLYRYDPAEGKLIRVSALVSGLRAADTVLHAHEGRWWLYFTDLQSTNERLNIWYSDHMEGPYVPHPANPVCTDIRSARPAGKLFSHQGKLLRPAQDCSGTSGKQIRLMEVLELTPTTYSEKEYAVLRPAPGTGYTTGMHTFDAHTAFTVIDSKKESFVLQAFIRKIRHKLNKFVRNS
jgi:hypothetical protein